MASLAYFKRTLPAPTATVDGFVCVLNEDWFLQANTDALDGSTFANGGGNLIIYEDAALTSRLPIHVISFVTGASASVQVRVRVPSVSVGQEVYTSADDTQTTQPLPSSSFGQYETWQDYELAILKGNTNDAAGNHAPFAVGSPALSPILNGFGYNLDLPSKWIQIPHSIGLNIGREYALDFWLKRQNQAETLTTYVDKVNSTNSAGFRLLSFGDGLLRTRHPTLSPANITSVDSASGTVMLSSDMDATTRKNVVNALVVGSDTPSGIASDVIDDFYIGHSVASTRDYFKGVLGDFFLRKTSVSDVKRSYEYLNQSDPSSFGTSSDWTIPSVGGVDVAITETLSPTTESSALTVTAQVFISAAVTESLSSFQESSQAQFTEQGSVELNITETLSPIQESSSALFSISVNTEITEALNPYSESSALSVSRDLTATITETLSQYQEFSSLRLPTNWVDKQKSTTDWSNKQSSTTIWIDKG